MLEVYGVYQVTPDTAYDVQQKLAEKRGAGFLCEIMTRVSLAHAFGRSVPETLIEALERLPYDEYSYINRERIVVQHTADDPRITPLIHDALVKMALRHGFIAAEVECEMVLKTDD